MNTEIDRRRTRGAGSSGTRDDLLRAARLCVREHGLAGATSRQITAEAGANLAAITYHFGSKDELIAEALFSEIERRVRPALTRLGAEGEPAQLMLQAVQELLAEFERSKRDTLVYLEALLMATRDARYRRRALKLYRGMGDALASMIDGLIADGVIPPWVEAEPMASLILSVANGIALQTRLDPTGPDQGAMAAQFAGLLLAASTSPAAAAGG
ncbi:MAG: TetR/AcrR family transcriptional regulator [Acidimicrobiales bacterium]